jgi:hypothetical protein
MQKSCMVFKEQGMLFIKFFIEKQFVFCKKINCNRRDSGFKKQSCNDLKLSSKKIIFDMAVTNFGAWGLPQLAVCGYPQTLLANT